MFRGAFVRLAHAEALHATGAHDTPSRAIAGRIADPACQTSFLEHVPEDVRTLALARAWLGDP